MEHFRDLLENVKERVKICLTLKIGNEFTEDRTKYEILEDGSSEREGHAEHAYQEVSNGQVKEKQICDCSHPLVLYEGQNNQDVPHDGQQENHRIESNLEGGVELETIGEEMPIGACGCRQFR